MKKVCLPVLAGVLVSFSASAQYADSVVSYTSGTGGIASYVHSSPALGTPTTFIGYQNTDPFNPPYQTNDIVRLAVGGSLTLQFNTPIENSGANPYGLDFIIFGHAGFQYGEYPATDGTLFTGGTADIRVSVSVDGITFFTLNPAFAPQVDALYPTDISGNPFLPVNPALTASDFNGLDLAGIQALYAGSAGGAGFNLDWALDGNNDPVSLSSVNYVRLEEVSGVGYIDAITVVPEPATWTLALVSAAGLVAWKRRNRA